MRSLCLLGALSAFFVGALAAQQTVVVTSAAGAGSTGRFADGTAWPTTGGFTFQVGLFPAGFDPAKEARATWSAAWTALRPTVASGAVDAWFLDGTQALFSISGTTGLAGATAGGEQYYVWGATTRSARPGAEWILLTNPAWRVVAGQTARLPDMFATTDAGTVAVFGERVGGGRELQSAPAFPGELRLMGQTTDFAVVAGEPATLSVKAGGSGFAYQWYTGRKGDTSQPLPRARQATYTLPSVLRTATFWVRLTDGVTNLDSETITVTATEAGAGITATQSFVAGTSDHDHSITSVAPAAGRRRAPALSLPTNCQPGGSSAAKSTRLGAPSKLTSARISTGAPGRGPTAKLCVAVIPAPASVAVTVMVSLSRFVTPSVNRAQNVAVRGTEGSVKVAWRARGSGWEMSPFRPVYHW